jgi:hypothetical protein
MMNDVDDEVDEENEIIESERRRQEKLEFRRQIDSNDPSLLHAEIGSYSYIPHDGDWGKFGASIGRNTFIEKVYINIGYINQGDFESFAPGFASNRSVQSLTLCCGMRGFTGETLGELLPFFMKNPAFKSLRVEYANPTCLRALASALRQFDTLAEFTLYDLEKHDDDHFDEYGELIDEFNDCEDFSVAVTEVIQALAGHSSLTSSQLSRKLWGGNITKF